MELFFQSGSQVRSRPSPFLMHHKFALVDGKRLLAGSFNWTMKAAMGNRENVVVTTDRKIVRAFKEEFQRLWVEMGRAE